MRLPWHKGRLIDEMETTRWRPNGSAGVVDEFILLFDDRKTPLVLLLVYHCVDLCQFLGRQHPIGRFDVAQHVFEFR